MKYAVRYQSRGGNTRAVAEIIAGILGINAEPFDRPLDENVDVTFCICPQSRLLYGQGLRFGGR
jgi:flavodoxin